MREHHAKTSNDKKNIQTRRTKAEPSCQLQQTPKCAHAVLREPLFIAQHALMPTVSFLRRNSLLRLQRCCGNRYVQQILDLTKQGEREAEVSPEIEGAIERSRGGGLALDSKARIQMESAFGLNFSGVRVHTDWNANVLNRVLNAKAFTTGKDIYFRQGEYQPGSSTGRELLAHELTHVVQQDGSRIKSRLRVGQANDSYEEEADEVAQAVMKNETRLRRQIEEEDELQAKPATRHTIAQKEGLSLRTLIQRRRIRIPATWWGSAPTATSDSKVWFDPGAALWLSGTSGLTRAQTSSFPRGNRTSFTLTPGSRGVIILFVNMGWFQDNILFNYGGSAYTKLEWDFTVTAGGELTLRASNRDEFTGGDGAQLVTPVPVQQSTSADGGMVQVSTQILSAGSVSAGGSPGYGGSSFSGSETTPRVSGWTRTFAVELTVPRPEAPLPTTYITTAHFDVNSDQIEEGGERHILGWYMGLPADVKRSVEGGNSTMILRGYASTTQPGPDNRELSRRRANRVQQILQDIAGSDARFRIYALGEYRARTADDVESSSERRVQMEVTYRPE